MYTGKERERSGESREWGAKKNPREREKKKVKVAACGKGNALEEVGGKVVSN